MKKIVIIDNYDSFTYNLVHHFEALEANVTVFRNNEFYIEELENFDGILLSPGPGIPSEAGLTMDVLKTYGSSKKILGVCLGLQAIGEFFGATLYNLPKVYHGIATPIFIQNECLLYTNLPNKFNVGRYHSWGLDPQSIPESLMVTATDEEGNVMSIKHVFLPIQAVQFHPESILTEQGKKLLNNWLISL